MHDAGVHAWWRRVHHKELEEPVVDEDPIAGVHIERERVVCDGDLAGAGEVLGNQHHFIARLEQKGAGQLADPDPRTLEITQDRDRLAARGGGATHSGDRFGVLRVRPVREVDAGDVHPRVDQVADCAVTCSGWTQRAHDLGSRPSHARRTQLAMHSACGSRSGRCGRQCRGHGQRARRGAV